jgi:hypothetical protein
MTESSTPLANKPGSGGSSADIAGQLAAAIVARLMAEELAQTAAPKEKAALLAHGRPCHIPAGKLAIRPGK